MTVWRPADCRTYRYDFWLFRQRHTGSTRQRHRDDAREFEQDLQRRLRRQAAGLEAIDPVTTPTFAEWADVTLAYRVRRRHLKRADQLADRLRQALAFWGVRPTNRAPVVGGVYRDLRLGDPIRDPALLEAFEDWMAGRGVSASRRNHLRSACSVMYAVAQLPAYRSHTGIHENPFARVERERVPRRHVEVAPAAVLAWARAAAPHVRLAVAIGALAPKLRLQNILALRWDDHLDAALTRIVVHDHKTDAATGLPLVTRISAELRTVLAVARAQRAGPWVIHRAGARVGSIRTGLRTAAARAGLTYGLAAGGITFHALRHAMATTLARLGVPEAMRRLVMGHADIRTTQLYTHLEAADEQAPLDALGAAVPLAAILADPRPPISLTTRQAIAAALAAGAAGRRAALVVVRVERSARAFPAACYAGSWKTARTAGVPWPTRSLAGASVAVLGAW